MKQTVVKWLFDQLEFDESVSMDNIEEIFNQAKAMEKKQNYNLDNLRDAYRWGTTVSIGTSDHFEEFVNNIKIK